MKLSRITASMCLFAASLVAMFVPLCAQAQATPSTSNISYKLTPVVSADNTTLTLTITATNGLAPSVASQTFSFNATTSETPPRTFTATAATTAVNDMLTGPVATIPIQQATSSVAGLTPPATLSPGFSISGNILTWTPGKLEGGATATGVVTFQIVQPTGQSAVSGAASSSH